MIQQLVDLIEIFVVTHGDKYTGPNPGMTPLGFAQIRSLWEFIPANPSAIKVGVGRRHADVLKALECTGPTNWSSVYGDSDSLEMCGEMKMVILADGTPVPLECHTSIADTSQAAKQVLVSMLDSTVICTGRPFALALGIKDAKSAAVYKVCMIDGFIFRIDEIAVASEDIRAAEYYPKG
jgi:hypothetical protein